MARPSRVGVRGLYRAADGRYEIVRARPAAKESEPPDGDGAN